MYDELLNIFKKLQLKTNEQIIKVQKPNPKFMRYCITNKSCPIFIVHALKKKASWTYSMLCDELSSAVYSII